jgi:hypothetical protein
MATTFALRTSALMIFQALAITLTALQVHAAPFETVYGNYHVAGCKAIKNTSSFNFCQYHEVSLSRSAADSKTSIVEFKRNIAVGISDKMSMGLKLGSNTRYSSLSDGSFSMVSADAGVVSITKIKQISNSQVIITLITTSGSGSFLNSSYNFEIILQK